MRACKQCGLSIGDTATFCPVCGALADPEETLVAATPESAPESTAEPAPLSAAEPAPLSASELEAEARACEKTDAPRAAALYRQAVVAYLESGEDPLDDPSVRRDVQRVFDRLSLVLKRDGRNDEALEELDAAAYLGLVDGQGSGTKARREALARRREALRRAVAEAAGSTG